MQLGTSSGHVGTLATEAGRCHANATRILLHPHGLFMDIVRMLPSSGRTLASALVLALGVSALAGAMTPPAFAEDSAGSSASDSPSERTAVAGIESAGPIPTMDAAPGERWPAALPSVGVMPAGSVRSGEFPVIYSAALAQEPSIAYRVIDLRTTRRVEVASSTLKDGWGTIPATLEEGGLYDIEVQAASGDWMSIGRLSVAIAGGSGSAPVPVGGAEVDPGTGVVTTSWSARPLVGPLGSSGATLAWTSGMPALPGLPEGWRLVPATGSSWATLLEDGQETEAVDVPGRSAASYSGPMRSKAIVRFAYPRAELANIERFVIAVRADKGKWRTVKKVDVNFADINVNQTITLPKGARHRVRVGAKVAGTVIWGPSTRISVGVRDSRTLGTTAGDLAGSGLNSVLTSGVLPDTVTLIGWDASRLNFVRNGLGVFEQVGGTAGFQNSLVSVADQVWEFTDTQGVVTRFDRGRAVEVWHNKVKVSGVTWSSDGRVTSLSNEIGRSMTFSYADQADCRSAAWSTHGFSAPSGQLLCAISYPDGTESLVGYVSAGSQDQIALIKDPGNEGMTWGWDTQGRLVSTRASLVSRVATVDPAAAAVIAAISYDQYGRAAMATEQPAAVGEPSITHSIDFPAIMPANLREWIQAPGVDTAVTAQVTSTVEGRPVSTRTSQLDPMTLQPMSTSDGAGRTMSRQMRSAGESVRSVTAPDGRVTTYTYNELGLVIKTEGPTTASEGLTLTSTFDTERSAGVDKPVNGLRTQVYPRKGFSGNPTPEFWRADYSRGALSAAWSDRPAETSLQGAAVWTPKDADDADGARDGWEFEVRSSGGTSVTLLVGTVACASSPCIIKDLPKGPKPITIQVDDAGSDGWFSVEAGPVGTKARAIASDELSPGYARVTVAASNDDLPGGPDGSQARYSFADLALGLVSSASSVGGLAMGYGYESTGWRRQTSVTQPSGQVLTITYWGDDETVNLPAECGSQAVRQSGQAKSTVRQDGSVVTTYYDISGHVRAVVTAGPTSGRETTCMTYTEGQQLVSVSLFDGDGILVEESVTTFDVGGDPRVTATTITHGPAAAVAPGSAVTTTTTVDLAGRPVSEVGIGGESTVTVYDDAGNVARRTMTPPEGSSGAPLVFDYTYRQVDGAPVSTSVNGVLAATIDYDDAAGRISSVSYANGISVGYGYLANGTIGSVTVTSQDASLPRVQESRTVSDYGRVTSSSLSVSGPNALSEDRGFVYDSAGRLVSTSIVGSASPTNYEYEFAAEQAGACEAKGYANIGKDGLRTGGSRDGVAFTQCYDERGRLVSTTDPLVTGGAGTSELTYDELGRVTAISGTRAAALTWSHGTSLARLVEIASDGSGLVDTRLNTFGGQVVDKTVTTDSGSDTLRYAGPFFIESDADTLGAVRAMTYGLPGGAHVTTGPDAGATITLPGITGATLVTLAVPALALGGSPAPGAQAGVAHRYGPYGEPLAPVSTFTADALPDYGWQSAGRRETLQGRASITLMGDRPYHPLTGMFLAPDPIVDSGTNLYSYTGGDPINSHDASGQMSEQESTAVWIGAGIAGALLGGAVFNSGALAAIKRSKALGRFQKSWRIPTTRAIGGLMAVTGAGAVGYGTYVAVKSSSDSSTTAILSAVGASIATLFAAGFAALPVYNRAGKAFSNTFTPAWSPTTIIKRSYQARKAAQAESRASIRTELDDLIDARSSIRSQEHLLGSDKLISVQSSRSMLQVVTSPARAGSLEVAVGRDTVGSLVGGSPRQSKSFADFADLGG